MAATSDLALVQGMAATRAALRRWNAAPLRAVGGWLALSLAIACALLLAVWLIAARATPDITAVAVPGLTARVTIGHVGFVLFRNSLVLALHALSCVAGFIARSSLPLEARRHRGLMRLVHERAGTVAIGFVAAATAFSLVTQAIVLGHGLADLSWTLGASPGSLLLTVLPHALPELVALFLPLAAWLHLSRQGRWEDLLAATFVTVAIAVPVLVAAAFIETYLWPHLLAGLAG
jgi:hypothetical protein